MTESYYIERPKELTFDLRVNWDKTIKRPNILTPDQQRYYDEYRKSGIKYKVETELEENARKRREERERRRKERHDFYEEYRRRDKERRQEEEKRKQLQKTNEFLEEAREEAKRKEDRKREQKKQQLDESQYKSWIDLKEKGNIVDKAVAALDKTPITEKYSRILYNAKNMIGDLLDTSLATRLTTLVGDRSMNDDFAVTAEAHRQLLITEQNLKSLTLDRQRLQMMLDDKDPNKRLTGLNRLSVIGAILDLDKLITEAQNTLNDPRMRQLSETYIHDQYAKWTNLIGKATLMSENIGDVSEQDKADRRSRDRALYSKYMLDKINELDAKDPSKKHSDIDVIDNVLKDINEENKELLEKYSDVSKTKNELDQYWQVSSGFRQLLDEYKDRAWYDPKYLYTNLPSLIGSSNSSPEQIAANAIQTVGTVASLALTKHPVASYTVGQTAAALAIPGLFIGGVDEAYANTGDKRIENVRNYLSDSLYTKPKDKELILADLRSQSVKYWKKLGMDDAWIKKNLDLNSEEGVNNIIKDAVIGNTKSNHPAMDNAMINSVAGLLALFESNVTRTMTGMPVTIAASFLPYDKTLSKLASNRITREFSDRFNVIDDFIETGADGKILAKTANSASRSNTIDNIVQSQPGKYKNGFRKKTAGEVFETGWDAGSNMSDMLGFGYVGHVLGGAAGGTVAAVGKFAKQMLPKNMARRLDAAEELIMRKYQKALDHVTGGKEWKRLALKYGIHSVNNNIIHRMEEASEEAAQHLYAQEDFAKKYGFDGIGVGELLWNDLRQGGRIFNASMAMLGLSNSELENDAEFWNNFKGGFVLGGTHVGAIVNVSSDVSNMIKQYSTNKVLASSIVMNREANKTSRASLRDVASETMKGRGHSVMNIFNEMENKDRHSNDPRFSQEEYDQKREDIENVIHLTNNKKIKGILEARGIKYGTQEYATAVADIYTLQSQKKQNQSERSKVNSELSKLYGASFIQEAENLVDDVFDKSNYVKLELSKIKEKVRNRDTEDIDNSEEEYDEQTLRAIRVNRDQLVETNVKHNAVQNVLDLSKTVHKLNALLKLKAKYNTISDWYSLVTDKLDLKVLRPDAAVITKNVQKQIDAAKAELAKRDESFNVNMSDAEVLLYLETIPDVIRTNSEKIEEQEAANAVLAADQSVIDSYLNTFFKDVIYNEDTKSYEYNPDEYKYENEQNRARLKAYKEGKVYEADKDHKRADKKDPTDNIYQKRIKAIMTADEENARLDWMISDIYQGDAVTKLMEEEAKKELERSKKEAEEASKKEPLFETTAAESATTEEEPAKPLSGKLAANKKKYQERKQRAKERYLRNKSKYKKFRRGSLHSSLPFEGIVVELFNSLIRSAETGSYKLALIIEDIKDIIDEEGFDINEYVSKIKQLYIKAITKYGIKNKDVLDNMSTIDEVVAYLNNTSNIYNRTIPPVEPVPQVLDYRNILKEQQDKVISEDSDFYFTFVKNDDGTVSVYTNQYALDRDYEWIDPTKYAEHNSTVGAIVEQYDNARRLGELQFHDIIERTHGKELADKYAKYYQVDGISEIIAAKSLITEPETPYMTNAKLARSFILNYLTTGDEVYLGDAFLSTELFPAESIEKVKLNLRSIYNKIVSGQYKIFTTNLNIYGTINGENKSTQLDLILLDKDNNIFVYDVVVSYNPIYENLDNKPTDKVSYTNIERYTAENNDTVELLLNSLPSANIKSIALIPMQIDQSRNVVNVENTIPLTLPKINSNHEDESQLELLKEVYEELLGKLTEELVDQHPLPDDFTTVAEIKNEIEIVTEQINSATINENQDSEDTVTQIVGRTIPVYDEIDEFIPEPQLDEMVSRLSFQCRELDATKSYLGRQTPKTKLDVDMWIRVAELAIRAQETLYDLKRQYPDVDVLQEEELIASVMEDLYKIDYAGGNVSKLTKYKNLWLTLLTQEDLKGTVYTKFTGYCGKMETMLKLIPLREFANIENDTLALKWYATILNKYFNRLVDNAELFSESLDDPALKKIITNLINNSRGLIESYRRLYDVEPDDTLISLDDIENISEKVEVINNIDVSWNSERYLSKSHSPSRLSLGHNRYQSMSLYGDFLTKGNFEFEIESSGRLVLKATHNGSTVNLYFDIPNPTSDNARLYNKGLEKFIEKVKSMLNFVREHGNYMIQMLLSRNAGSIEYETVESGKVSSAARFIQMGTSNKLDIHTMKLDAAHRIGIYKPTKKSDSTEDMNVFTGETLDQVLFTFKGDAVENNTQVNAGLMVFLKVLEFEEGEKTLPVIFATKPLVNNATELAELLVAAARGEVYRNGFSIIDLLQMYVYYSDKEYLNKHQYITNLISIKNGQILIAKDPINMDVLTIAERISKMSNTLPVELLNEELYNTQHPVLSSVRASLISGQYDSITIPGGMTFTKEDFLPGRTYLGYLLSHDIIVTRAKRISFAELNVDDVRLIEKSLTAEPTPSVITKALEDANKTVVDNSSNMGATIDDLFSIVNEDLLVDRAGEELESFKNNAQSYFEKVLGESSAYEVVDEIKSTAAVLTKNQRIAGLCSSNIIKLLSSAPESTIFHEAFHKVMELLMTELERSKYYELYRKAVKNGSSLSEREVAEELTDLFVVYMDAKGASLKTKGIGKILAKFRPLALLVGMSSKYGVMTTFKFWRMWHQVNNGTYAQRKISQEKSDLFKLRFGEGLFYTVKNTDTNTSAEFSFIASASDVKDMAKSLGYIIGTTLELNNPFTRDVEVKINGETPNILKKDLIDSLCGNHIDDEQLLTDSQRAFREVFEVEVRTRVKYKHPSQSKRLINALVKKQIPGFKYDEKTKRVLTYDPWFEGYVNVTPEDIEKYPELNKYLEEERVETYNYYPKFAALSKHISDYFSQLLVNYDGKLKLNDEDFDEDESVSRANMDKYDKASYEFNKLDSVSKSAKLFFATIPYYTDSEENGKFVLDTSRNKYGTPLYMPLNEVYSLIVNDLYNIDTAEELYKCLENRSQRNPMYYAIFKKFKELYDNQVIGGKVSYDTEARITAIRNAIKSHKILFMTALSEKTDGGVSTRIVESSFDRDARSFPITWNMFLTTGQTGIFQNTKVNGQLQFTDKYKFVSGKPDIFKRTASMYESLRSNFTQGKPFMLGNKLINPASLKDLGIVKDFIIRSFNALGIMFTRDAMDFMLEQLYGNIGLEGMSKWFNSTDSGSSLSAFIEQLNRFVSPDGVINTKHIENVYKSIGFVKNLGTWLGKTNRMRTEQQVMGLDGKKLYSVSQNNTISQISSLINKNLQNDPILNTIKQFSYNLSERNGFSIGGIVLKALQNGADFRVVPCTYIGFRTDNNGDFGTPYQEEQELEDYIAKMTMLLNDMLIFPTLADKGTWMFLQLLDNDGIKKDRQKVHIPGMKFISKDKKNMHVMDAPTLKFIKGEYIIRPANSVLDQFIEYAYCERLAIVECMEDLGYENIPTIDSHKYDPRLKSVLSDRDKVVNYHTKRKDGVEPNGTRFWSLTGIKFLNSDGNWETKNFNNPNESSIEMLKKADKYFFNKTQEEQREIIAYTLHTLNMLEVEKAIELGLVERIDVTTQEKSLVKFGNDVYVQASNNDTLKNLNTNRLNEQLIQLLTEMFYESIINSKKEANPQFNPSMDYTNTIQKVARSLAIAAILGDVTNRSIICAQETDRLFIGHPGFFKTFYDKEKGVISDYTSDKQKRVGGLVSTGEDNRVDLPGVRSHYTCAELNDYEIASHADVIDNLLTWFEESQLREMYGVAKEEEDPMAWDNAYSLSIDEIRKELSKLTFIDNDGKSKNVAEKALDNAIKYADSYRKEGKVNVADGASYISEEMCETLLRMRGAYSDDVRAAFELLSKHRTGEDGYNDPNSWKKFTDAYRVIYDAVNIVTTKYTAYGFRNHGKSKIAIPYYNKTALFPLFDCLATGPMYDIYQKMRNEKVDMLMMTSAIKIGSEGATSYNDKTKSIDEPFHTYQQPYSTIRRQLNTDPEEEAEARVGTQMVKIVLQNLKLDRLNYRSADGSLMSGKQLLDKYMDHIKDLSDIGCIELLNKFFKGEGELTVDDIDNNRVSPDQIDYNKLSQYLISQMSDRNASKALIEALQLNETKDGLNAPLAATQDASWIESILISTINNHVIDVMTPGGSFTQRSVFATEKSSKSSEGAGKIVGAEIYNGRELLMINEEGSMDAVISIDYFDHILPPNLSFDDARQWLIENEIISGYKLDGTWSDAKANTVGYRIPTQAQSSIHALRFVDVVPATKAAIILPKEFTAITGSDFDIDHLYVMSYNYVKTDETVEINGRKLSRVSTDINRLKLVNNPTESHIRERRKKESQNGIIDIMMTLLKDNRHSLNSTYRSIDNDTSLVRGIADKIPNAKNVSHVPYNYGTLHELITRRNDYITGKNGIGPFALNVTNQILTQLYGVRFKSTEFTDAIGLTRLDRILDTNYNPVSSWLSAFINAHVDIVKDPYISKVNVNPYTYNILNLLVRCGFGDTSMWFVCQPVIRKLAQIDSMFRSNYMKDPANYKTKNDVINAELRAMDIRINEDLIVEFLSKNNIKTRISTAKRILLNPKLLKAIALNPDAREVTVSGRKYNVANVQKDVYLTLISLRPYIGALSKLVQYTKIDTRKHGKTFIEQALYLSNFEELSRNEDEIFDQDSLNNLLENSWIGYKTRRAISLGRMILGSQTFTANNQFISVLQRVADRLGKSDAESMKKISNHIITYIKNKFIMEYAKTLGITDIRSLFVGNTSVHTLLNRWKYAIANMDEYKHLRNNALLNQLICEPISDNIVFNGKLYEAPKFITISQNIGGDRLESDLISDAWEDLLNDPNPKVRAFAKKLIVYAYVTSGEFKGWNKLFKYVPFSWKSTEIVNTTNIQNQTFNQFVEGQLTNLTIDDIDFLADNIAGNNFLDRNLVSRMRLDKLDAQERINGELVSFMITTPKDLNLINEYITVKSNPSASRESDKYNIYKLLAQGESTLVYGIIRKRGYHEQRGHNIYEYDFDSRFTGSTKWRLTETEYDHITHMYGGEREKNFLELFEYIPAKSVANDPRTPVRTLRISRSTKYYTRRDVENDPTTLYIFTDNTDRTSGGTAYSDGWYKQKYGKEGGYGSNRNPTSAIIRGLENAAPVSTMRYFYRDHPGMTHPKYDPNSEARWHDKDFDEFKQIFDEEIELIKRLWDTGKYKLIILPMGDEGNSPFFGSKLTAITPERTPKIHAYMRSKFTELNNYVNNTTPKQLVSIVDQVLDHLRYMMGLSVGIREDMKLFFEANLDALVQESVSTENDDIQMFVVGEKGARSLDAAEEATTRMDNLSVANEMEKAGKDALTIKVATGWERGADDKWRYEIPDVQISESIKKQLDDNTILNYHYHDYQEDTNYSKKEYSRMIDQGFEFDPWVKKEYIPKSFKLSDIIKHNETIDSLINSYPIFKDLTIIIDSRTGNVFMPASLGNYNKETNTLTVNKNNSSEFEKTLIHELQHVIQNIEEFSYGANLSQFDNHPEVIKQKNVVENIFNKLVAAMDDREAGKLSQDEYFKIWNKYNKEKFKLENLPFELYNRVAGEVEARTVSTRSNLSIEERRNSLFTDDMYKDVAKEDLIFLDESLQSSNIQAFMTPSGEVYGFVDKDDNIYLDENIISPEHPIHEYTHLWDRYVAKKNPQLWKRGIEIMKQTPLWDEVANDPNYGLKWKSMKNMSESRLENLIASEVHSRLVGEEGAALLDELAEEKGQENIISKLKEWILEFWKELKATFSNWSEEDLNKLTLDDFTYMTVRDFAEGINPISAKSFTQVKNTHDELIADLGGDEIAESEVRDTVQVAKKGISFDLALSTVNPIFTQEEIALIKLGLNGDNLMVMSLSRYTDPAFFANEIIKFLELNAKKPFTDPTRVNAMEIWSKHDGEPILKILKACRKYKVAPMVSFSITTLGDTALEKGVLKHTDLIPLISKLIENGDLDPRTTTVRIDPIFVGVTNMNDIRNVVNECKKLGIKKFVTSLMLSYDSHRGRFSRRVPNNRGGYNTEYRYDLVREETKNGEVIVKDKNGNILRGWKSDDRFVVEGINKALAEDGKSYDWEKYYGTYWNKRANRKEIWFKPKQEYITEIGKVLLDIAKDPEIKLETCSFTIPGLKASACLDPLIIERITGVDVTSPSGTYKRDTSRPECMCYGCHGDFFKWNEKKCYSSCAYCYAGHSSDSNFKYYNEDGTIIDRPISRVLMDNVLTSNASEADALSQMRKAGEQVRKDCKGE